MKFILGKFATSKTQELLIELGAHPEDFSLDQDGLSFNPDPSSGFSVSEVTASHPYDGSYIESRLKYGETLIGTKAADGCAQIKTDQIQSLIDSKNYFLLK